MFIQYIMRNNNPEIFKGGLTPTFGLKFSKESLVRFEAFARFYLTVAGNV